MCYPPWAGRVGTTRSHCCDVVDTGTAARTKVREDHPKAGDSLVSTQEGTEHHSGRVLAVQPVSKVQLGLDFDMATSPLAMTRRRQPESGELL